MIGQYLANNNEMCYSTILLNFSEVNRPQEHAAVALCRDRGGTAKRGLKRPVKKLARGSCADAIATYLAGPVGIGKATLIKVLLQ
jgi:poly(3-hydroxybutyrate) depolymerase